jgi:hypothetical protein
VSGLVDGRVELEAVLREPRFEKAGLYPRSPRTIYRDLSEGLVGDDSPVFEQLVRDLVHRLSVWWSPEAYSLFPVIVPWAVRDRSCRYDAGPEAWGSPRDDGCLRDDNSIIKKLPLSAVIAAPKQHRFAGKKLWRGFTACHIWRDLPGATNGGEDPWLYSFLPNLVWLPTPLAPLSDRQGSFTQALLQVLSRELFAPVAVAPSVAIYAAQAWQKLPAPVAPRDGADPHVLARFSPTPAFLERRLAYNRRLTDGVNTIASGSTPEKKIICSRYTTGLPNIAPTVLNSFVSSLRQYNDAVGVALIAA